MAAGFAELYSGRLWSLLSWEQLSAFWQRIDPAAGWYVYAVGEALPAAPADAPAVSAFVSEVDALLRRDHHHDYCGIVYANDIQQPTLVKIYDPNNLGVSCGYSDNPPPPGWVMSRVAPEPLGDGRPPTASRRRWWQGWLAKTK